MAETSLLGDTDGSIFAVVENLLQFHEKLKAITDIKGKMEDLKNLSEIIDCRVIQEIESRPFIGDAGKDLLKKLKYLVYDMEDAVDYYDTKVLQKKQRSKTFLRPVSDFFSSDNPVLFKSRVGGMIKAITENLDSILWHNSMLRDLTQGMPERRHEATHYRNSSVVIGRETEKNMIVNMLTDDSHGVVKIITIVGMGGLGKTTLAQLVFNDEKVKAHFKSSRMWTVVGAEFNPARIMKSVLEQATNALVPFSEIDSMRQNLEKALSGKKFLLVLDDVRNGDPLQWGILKEALTCGERGSKILVTTRNQPVSKIMGSSNTTHQIKHLSRHDCLFLFQQFAFRDDEAADPSLMEIGGKIVEKCGGVPLAIISLGNMLRGTRDETNWSLVLKSEIWQLGNEEDKVLTVLKWSYNTLPLRSKKCFAFGSLFPKGYMMQKDILIKLWIANGCICSEGNVDAEIVGNYVFDDLVLRSFFLLAPSRYFEDVTKCTMHDLMHDLARSVSANVYWNSYQDSVEDIGIRTYHLQIVEGNLPDMTQVLRKKPLYLRTFMLPQTFPHFCINLHEVFSELKFLRALDLTGCGIREIPTSIGNLTLLRRLELSKNEIEVLPDSITLLLKLQYFNLSFNSKLQKLPKKLGNMQNLRELDLEMDYKLTHIPSGLSRLTNLQSLPLFIAGDKADACSIIELEDLKLHGKMTIKFSDDFGNYCRCSRKILKNKNLNELFIEFHGSESYHKDMLDDLCPNTSLKKLQIWNYRSPQFPTWLMELQLPNLVEVGLYNCSGGHIPPFGNLQCLKTLRFSMHGITHLGVEFHGSGGFPSLQELYLRDMYTLEEWSESHDVDELFPLLQKLNISRCPKLKSMPMLPRIQHLLISDCSESLLSCIGKLTSLSVLRVDSMGDMTSLPGGCIRNLTSLTRLEIIYCRELQSLPWDEIQHLEMLRSLTIEWCDNLIFLSSEVGRFNSLRFLRLSGCPSIISHPEELIQILNLVHYFQIQICGNKVNLSGRLQDLDMLEELSLSGVHDVSSKYQDGNRKLHICCCDELESLMTAESASNVLEELYIDGISNLAILPDWLQHLKFLRLLSVKNCPRLERVPRDLKNLHMLEDLTIVGSPQLESRCERETGEDWPIISHVPNVCIRSSNSA